MERFTLKKEERLCSKKTLEQLFTEGESFLAYPLKIVFIKTEPVQSVPVSVAFAVSKRNFKRAVRRNLLKRRMREAYRTNKPELCKILAENKLSLALIFIYIGKETSEFPVIEKAMNLALKKVAGRV